MLMARAPFSDDINFVSGMQHRAYAGDRINALTTRDEQVLSLLGEPKVMGMLRALRKTTMVGNNLSGSVKMHPPRLGRRQSRLERPPDPPRLS